MAAYRGEALAKPATVTIGGLLNFVLLVAFAAAGFVAVFS